MSTKTEIVQILKRPTPETFLVLFDLLEEHSWDPELVAWAAAVNVAILRLLLRPDLAPARAPVYVGTGGA